ncbi:hypothetical protein GGR56DRAFT_635141 [Xylariaceae sp. FL0804]|nr:hypothetical protein GGR56DRAFT_635141 [Xylariaceae sp. FL0804]
MHSWCLADVARPRPLPRSEAVPRLLLDGASQPSPAQNPPDGAYCPLELEPVRSCGAGHARAPTPLVSALLLRAYIQTGTYGVHTHTPTTSTRCLLHHYDHGPLTRNSGPRHGSTVTLTASYCKRTDTMTFPQRVDHPFLPRYDKFIRSTLIVHVYSVLGRASVASPPTELYCISRSGLLLPMQVLWSMQVNGHLAVAAGESIRQMADRHCQSAVQGPRASENPGGEKKKKCVLNPICSGSLTPRPYRARAAPLFFPNQVC